MSKLLDQTIALGGLAQAVKLVDDIANGLVAPEHESSPLYDSLFRFDADDVASVYGGTDSIQTGLHALTEIFGSNPGKKQHNQLRYMMGVLNLQSRLAAQPDMLEILSNRLQHAQRNLAMGDDTSALAPNLASIYEDTIGTLGFRILVTGDQAILQQTHNAQKIRSLLLCAVRSATLWHQLGGKRWKLAFQRSKIKQIIKQL